MPLISKTISGFFNGVSQQPPAYRKDSQCELQENYQGSLVDGLLKRPNTEHLATLTSNAPDGCFSHKIDRDATDRFIVIITGDATEPLEVFTLAGAKYIVKYGHFDSSDVFSEDSSVKSYLVTASNPVQVFKAITITDSTIVVNTTTTPAMTTDTASGTLKGAVQSFSDLPDTPSVGDIYEITGDNTNQFDNYYMVYTSDSVWEETLLPGILTTINKATMPHKLVKTGATEFSLGTVVWDNRVVGDTVSSPEPSFIGNPIGNLFFFKNRLGFLSGDSVIMSKSGSYFDFFPTTALDILADDPIDVKTTTLQISKLRSTAIFNKTLLVFADQQQFDLGSGDGSLTPQTVAFTPTTRYNIISKAEPVTAGASVYFACPNTKYTAIREYYIQPDSLVDDAADVTSHVPQYILNGFIQLESSNSLDLLLCHSDAAPNTVYVYKYFWVSSTEKGQSAWSKWTFDGSILGMHIIGSIAYFIVSRGEVGSEEVSLEKLQLENIPTGALTFRVCLDRLVLLTGVYSSETGKTSWTLPYAETDDLMLINSETGKPLLGATLNSNILSISGDYSETDYYIGKVYTSRYRFSEWFIRDDKEGAILEGRLQLRTLTLSFTNTGYFKIEVTPNNRDTITREYSGVCVGLSKVGATELTTGQKRFPLLANSKGTTVDLVNDSYLPCGFSFGSYEGFFNIRSQVLS